MSTPTPKNSKLEDPDVRGAEPQLTPATQILPSQTITQDDRLRAEESDPLAADAEAIRAAHARINQAIGVIRSLSSPPPHASVRDLPPAANLNLPECESAIMRTTIPPPPRPTRDLTGTGLRQRSGLDPEIMPEPPKPCDAEPSVPFSPD